MTNKISHIELASSNVGASAEFYGALFDWKIELVPPLEYNYHMTVFEEGETTLAFTPVNEEQGVKPGDVLVYVDVADIDAFLERARSLQAPIYLDKMEIAGVGWMAMVGDPGGNKISVMQRMGG